MLGTLLWIGALILAVFGVISLVNGSIAMGIILLIAAAVVGPGGYSYVGR
ncbi:MAG: hypothetical protein KDB86_09760 [Actinobacteria bacterium]|nr:hypothetical protein [Actinomycetota bacterium]MCB9389481.1 hypothetical protein [Acidimicrobiia bacterium]